MIKRQRRMEKAKTSLLPTVRDSTLCRLHWRLTEMAKTMRKTPKKRVSKMKPIKVAVDKEIIFSRGGPAGRAGALIRK